MIKDELLTIIEENDISVLTKYKLDKICKYADEIEKNDNEINIVFRFNRVSIKLYGEEAKKKDETVIRIKRKDNPIRYYNDYREKPSEEVDRITFLKRFFYYEMCDLESEYDRLINNDKHHNRWKETVVSIMNGSIWRWCDDDLSEFIEFVDNDINDGDVNSMEGIDCDYIDWKDDKEWEEEYGGYYPNRSSYGWRRYRAGLYWLSNWNTDVLYNFPRIYYILLDNYRPMVEFMLKWGENKEELCKEYNSIDNCTYRLYRMLYEE